MGMLDMERKKKDQRNKLLRIIKECKDVEIKGEIEKKEAEYERLVFQIHD